MGTRIRTLKIKWGKLEGGREGEREREREGGRERERYINIYK